MSCYSGIQKKLNLHLLFFIFLLGLTHLKAQGIKRPSYPQGLVPITIETYPGLSRFFVDSTLFKSRYINLRREVKLDSTQKFVEIRERLFNWDYRLPIRMELDYYVQQRLKMENRKRWTEIVLRNLMRQQEVRGGGIELNIPVKIKSKAFKRIFGGDRVGLRVTGNISFDLAGRTESRSGSAVSSIEQRGNFSPKFNQTQQFRVEGKVGDKVSVSVDQNSEATFDFENTLRLTYDGDEDEIVQKIEAGNVTLSLPATHYVSTSAKHQGLFGLKTQMRMGNFSFTGIASLQRGEKQKITKTGAARENTFRIKDYDFVRFKYFLVDSVYMVHFEDFDERMRWQQSSNVPRITQLDVWKSTTYDDPEGRSGFAVLNPENYIGQDSLPEIPGRIERGKFKRLEFPKDYSYDEIRGFFWINEQVFEQDIVAIAYRTENGVQRGMLFSDISDSTQTIILKLIKPRAAKPEFKSTWQLMMKNVYNLGAANIPTEGFDVKVLLTAQGEEQEVQPVPPQETFNFLMGLDRLNDQAAVVEGGDKQIDLRNGFIFDLANGYLIFPELTPFAPDNPMFAIDSSLHVNIYDIKDRTLERERSKFDIEITTSSISTSYNLGFNVLEGSEVVRLNGRQLEKDKEYTIDYFSGSLQITAPEARRADAQVEIEYERGSLFQLDKKTLLGGRLEYNFGERNFLGFTALYFNQTTLDQRIRIGQEPLRNLIWDINTAFSFKPNFLTKIFDKLPVVETSAESNLKIEMEYAQVNPNPNTFNEPKLGDDNGAAYIDDFEGSKRFTSLGVNFRMWSFASIPSHFYLLKNPAVDYDIGANDDDLILHMDRNRVRLNWFNPFNQVPIKDIWPNKDVNTQTGTTTDVLNLRWKNESIPVDSAWAGIMRSTISFPDQKKTKYIELWVKGSVGQINVDIGRISEDYWVRGKNFEERRSLRNLNTEDFNGNGLLDEGEDVGIDGIPNGQPGDDPDDDWARPEATSIPFFNINGTEGNSNAQGAKYPDTEDLDGDGNVNLFNEYFEYSFDLSDESHPFIQGSTSKGWRLYRIPIREYQFKVGNPDTSFQEIFFVRLWLNNLPPDNEFHQIQIATFEFVGNEWEEQGLALSETGNFITNDSLFSIAVYNTEENVEAIPGGPEPYHPPPHVTGIRDRITRALSKEQSLVLQMHQLPAGAKVEAKKQLPDRINLLHYRKLKMFVHGDQRLTDLDTLEFFMKFGAVPEVYYEIGERVYPHWDPKNEIVLDFDELTRTKHERFLTGDTIGNKPVYFRRDVKNPEKYFRVVGTPGLHNIRYIIFGVRNKSDHELDEVEVWLDELRVTDVERDKGVAMRLFSELTLADIGRFSAQWEVVDDNFRRLEQQFPSSSGKDVTRERQSYFGSLKLHKFLPESWGLEIPIDGRFSRTQNIPKYFFNSDQRTHYSISGFTDRLKQFFGMNQLSPELRQNSSLTETRSIGATIRRRKRLHDPWLLRYTLNQMVFDLDYSNKHFSNPNTLFSDTRVISGRFNYSIPFSQKNFIQPFRWLRSAPLLRILSSQKLYYTPSNVSVNFTLNDNETISQNRLEAKRKETIKTNTTRQITIGYKLLDNLSMDYNRNYKSDAFHKGYRAGTVLKKIFSDFDFGLDRNVSQRFSINYNPKMFLWLKTTFRYKADFTYNLNNPETNNRSSNLNREKQFTFDLKPSVLANKIYSPGKKSRKTRAPQSGRRAPRGKSARPRARQKAVTEVERIKANSEETQVGKEKAEKKKPGPKEGKKKEHKPAQAKESGKGVKVPNPAVLLWKFFDAWRSLQLNFQIQDNLNHYNLAQFPDLKYQFGFKSHPGVGIDTSFNKIPILPSLKNTKRVTGSLNFDFAKNLTTTFRYNYNKLSVNNNQNHTESVSSGYFFLGEDPEAAHKSWKKYIPDWTLRLTGLEKLSFISRYARKVTLEHTRTGKFSERVRFEGDERIRDQWSFSNTFQPFLGINITTKWNLTGTVRYTKSSTFNYSRTGAVTKNLQSSFNINASYSATKGMKLPLPFLKNKRLNNEIQFTLVFDQTKNLSFSRRPGEDAFQELQVNKSWKLRPSISYRFSPKVNGTAFFEQSVSENKRTGKFSFFEFGVNVNIAIR